MISGIIIVSVLVLGTFSWMGINESAETGEGWARIGLRWMLWSALFVGAALLAVWAWAGLSTFNL